METIAGVVAGVVGGSFTNALGMLLADGISKVTGLHRDTGRLYLQTALGTFAISAISSRSQFELAYKIGQLSSSIFWATLLGVNSQEVLQDPQRKKTVSKIGGVLSGSVAAVVTNIFFGLPLANVMGAIIAYHRNA